MKWRKLGVIFCPYKNHEWMYSHATVPFAEYLEEDKFKIYFSTRDKDNKSVGVYIIIDIQNPLEILEISNNPILEGGELGTFDDSGTMLSCLVKHNNKKYLYYIGWNLGITVPFRNSIGLAIFKDNEFIKIGKGPILDRSLVEPHFVASCCVMVENNIWRMWYLSCTKWDMINGKVQHSYHIKYAESLDGVNWKRDGVVCIDFKSEKEYAISRPCVIKENGIYKMWYSYRGSESSDTYRIGYAESKDGITWIRKDEQVGIDISESGWDSQMIEYPFVFMHKGKKYMLYNGNNYGKTGFGIAVLEDE